MDLRLALLDLAERHQLNAADTARLHALAELDQEPPQLMRVLPAGLAVLAAVMAGLGIIFWVAANWDLLSRTGRFALLESVVFVMCLGAWRLPRARMPLGLLALLSTGGLLAFFGQTYQTGADPWQLFAWWALLALPLCLGIRHDAIWTAWSMVVLAALNLWARAQGGHGWQSDALTPGVQLTQLLGALLLTLGLSPICQRYTGAGAWSLRVSMTLTIIMISISALESLFSSSWAGMYLIGLMILGGAAAAFCQRKLFDVFAISALGLGLNVVIVGGLARLLFHGHPDPIFPFLLLALLAAGLLGATVKAILSLTRHHAQAGAQQ
jgi:uncharacterized membrane protein